MKHSSTIAACSPQHRWPRQRTALLLMASVIISSLATSLGCGQVARFRNVEGVNYFQQGNYQAAQKQFQSALAANPRSPDAYYNLAAVYHKQGLSTRNQNDLAQAESLYRQCLDFNPNHVDCHRGLAVLLTETGRADLAFTEMKNWSIANPGLSDARVELARLYEEYGDNRSAEQILYEAQAIDINNWRAHAALGRIKEQSGDVQQAILNYQRAYALNGNQPQFQERIAMLQQRAPGVFPTPGTTSPIPGVRSATSPRPQMKY